MAKSQGCGCWGIVNLALFALVACTWAGGPVVGGVSTVVGVLFIGWLNSSPYCDICGSQIKRSSYRWKVGGKKRRVCPSCDSQLERKLSRRAVRKYW